MYKMYMNLGMELDKSLEKLPVIYMYLISLSNRGGRARGRTGARGGPETFWARPKPRPEWKCGPAPCPEPGTCARPRN